ncbi:MAG: hypothetical protein ABIN36_04945 [Ferruginibacter sp.]
MKQLLVYCLILLSTLACSQIPTVPLDPAAIKTISLKNVKADALTKIFLNGLMILDSRGDTSNIGYSPVRPIKKYCFKKGFTKELSDWCISYLNINPQNRYGHLLLINIKKLRVSDDAVSKSASEGKEGQAKDGWYRGVITKVEFFIQEDSLFVPLYRFDSIVPFKGHPDKDAPDYLSVTLKMALDKLFYYSVNDLQLKRRIRLSDIIKANKPVYDLPVYNNQVHQRGVYKTFEDFKMNNTSYPDFVLNTASKSDILYVKENGSEVPLRSAWGYCDGLSYYINSGDKYSQLIPTGNTFYFQGLKSLSNYTIYVPANGLLVPGLSPLPIPVMTKRYIKNDKILKYYQLDMENGKVY